jgi:CSLREA domain-containing protein
MRTTSFSSASYKFLAALAVIAMVLAALPVLPAYAANITVETTVDELTTNGSCSLREAIINSNNNGSTHPDCTTGSGADVIILTGGQTYTLSLTGVSSSQTGDLDITDANGVTIQSDSTTSAIIDADDIDRILDVALGAGNVTLNYITVTDGTPTSGVTGGGINFGSSATLTLNNSMVSNNTASSTTSCGGGLYNNTAATVNIVDSTFENNVCAEAGADGAGIFKGTGGVMNISGSTFSGNNTNEHGGAMHIAAGTVNITNSTFYNNSGARGGAVQAGGATTVTIEFSTFSNNVANPALTNSGGAVQVTAGSVFVNRSILANSTGKDCDQSGTGTVSVTDSLIENNMDCTGTITTGDPGLGALANNGGPTQTMAIDATSPAYNGADSCASVTTDQRGIARPQGAACDLGAFELEDASGPAPTIVSITRADPDPTSEASVQFTVTFSENVFQVGASDFSPFVTGGITGASVTNVNGSGDTRTVTMNTGNGSGTLRLDVHSGATIIDADDNNVVNIPFLTGEFYTVDKAGAFNWDIRNIGQFLHGQGTDIPVPGDYDGDGDDDVTVFRESNSTWYVLGVGPFQYGTTNDIPVVGDYNGDGIDDIAVFRESNNTWYIRGIGPRQYGTTGDIPVVGDYNGDGIDDVAVFRPSTNNWHIYGQGFFAYGQSGDIPVVGDYNGDGKDDAAVFRPSNNTWYIRGIGPFPYGTTGDIPVVGDYNGDGIDDIAVFRPSNDTWYIRGIGPVQYGEANAVPVPADYDGDGVIDIAVFLP